MPAVGVLLIAGSLVYWARIQASPRYVAMRAANALYGGGSFSRLPFHETELEMLGLDHDGAVRTLELLRHNYLRGARIVSEPEFQEQPGKDVLRFRVQLADGRTVESVVEVIYENGRGVVQFGDLVASCRTSLYYIAKDEPDPAATYGALNGVKQLLKDQGVEGYWDLGHNRMESWPEYGADGEAIMVAQS